MGLDTTHGCWHGSYGSFAAFRSEIARAAGYPPLNKMVGYSTALDAIGWFYYLDNPLTVLLNHSDCDGYIEADDCLPLANALDDLIKKIEVDWVRELALRFVDGLRLAAEFGERVEFR